MTSSWHLFRDHSDEFKNISIRIVFILSLWFCANHSVAQDDGNNNFPADPGTGVTVQLPVTGVSIDAQGVLRAKQFDDNPGNFPLKQLAQNALNQIPGNLKKRVDLRLISLRQLEAAIADRMANGGNPDDIMRHLAGLTRLQYVMLQPENRDIIIAGTAEPWRKNGAGRVVGIESGKPTLLLEDLLTALRSFGPGKPLKQWIGCSIDPTPQGITQLKQFQKSLPARVPQHLRNDVARRAARGLQDSLGMADIRVYGLPSTTHMAQVWSKLTTA